MDTDIDLAEEELAAWWLTFKHLTLDEPTEDED